MASGKELAWEEFRAGRLVLESRPFRASIEITRNCNFKCVMCAQAWDPLYARYNPAFNMTPALFGRIARELFPRLEYAHLQGFGETTVSPHWPEILETCRSYAKTLRFGLVTNLSRRDSAMWRKMIALGFTIIFSCDGATAGTFEKIRPGGDFGHILENLEVIRRARAEFGRGRLYFYSVLQTLNIGEMPALVDFAASSGADRITFTGVNGDPYLPASGGKSPLDRLKRWTSSAAGALGVKTRVLPPRGTALGLDRVPRTELARLRDDALERGRSLGITVILNDAELAGGIPAGPRLEDMGAEEGIRDSIRVAARGRCFKPYSYLAVNYRGDVGPCNYLTGSDKAERLGSLAGSSFDEIWNSPAYREIRRALNAGKPEHAGCRWCFARRIAE